MNDYIQKHIDINGKNAIIYSPIENQSKATLFYLHGGALLYGSNADLPEYHIKRLTASGYTIVSFSYPLAPQAKLMQILEDICLSITCYTNDFLRDSDIPCFLFGRSAGAYLCLLISAFKELNINLKGIISFYGYGFLNKSLLLNEHNFYNTLPNVGTGCLENLPEELTYERNVTDFMKLYICARQNFIWKDSFMDKEADFENTATLLNVDKLNFPLFLAHSINDPDVPYQEFQSLSEKYPCQKYISMSKEHDFDRTDTPFLLKQLLDKVISFIEMNL